MRDGNHARTVRPNRTRPSCSQGQGRHQQSTRAQCLLSVVAHGCKWRGLPQRFGIWHTLYTRISRWSKAGVLDRIVAALQQAHILRLRIEAVSLDLIDSKVHPDGTGALNRPA